MKHLLKVCLILGLLASAAWAQDKAKEEKPATPAEEFKALLKEYQTKQREAVSAFREAKSRAEQMTIREKLGKLTEEYAGRMMKLAQQHPKAEFACDALLWVVSNGGESTDGIRAMRQLMRNHLDSPKLDQLCMFLASSASEANEENLRVILEKSPAKSVQAQACFGLGQSLKSRADQEEGEKVAKLTKEAEVYFDRVVAKFADVKMGEETLADLAGRELFELRNLAIGKEVPEIEGVDADGKKFKLSDYRGKVVMIDFWASWCGPCMALVPHNRELVEKNAKKPFALLGVNCDDSREKLKQTEDKSNINWRSFFDGSEGPVGKKWNVRYIPMIYVLDHKGVIRYKNVHEEALDRALDKLIKEAESDKEKK